VKRSLKLLWIIVAACVLCACAGSGSTSVQRAEKAFDELRSAVTKGVAEPGRQTRALAAVDGLQAAALDFSDRFARFEAEIEHLNADPDTSRDALAAKFHAFNAERNVLRGNVVKAHLALLAEVGAESWPKVSDFEQKALLAAVSTRGAK